MTAPTDRVEAIARYDDVQFLARQLSSTVIAPSTQAQRRAERLLDMLADRGITRHPATARLAELEALVGECREFAQDLQASTRIALGGTLRKRLNALVERLGGGHG